MITYLSLFSGIGAFEKALKNLNVEFQLIGYSEIDKYASKAYSLIHGVSESLNFGDITAINEKSLPKYIDLITYGFPCQDISIAGLQKGFKDDDGNLTRSGLFFDALRIIEQVQPKIAIAENVKNLVNKSFEKQFEVVLKSLEKAGYNNYWKVLNAKDYGVPQNRERVFIISIRKDVDSGVFQFPQPFTLSKGLKDVLEPNVDEKFYISDEKVSKIKNSKFMQEKRMIQNTNGVCQTLLARDYRDPKCVQVGNCRPTKTRENPNQGRIYDPIRKLTPMEYFRLMGFEDFDCQILIKNKISNTQLYKMAGNSIVVDVAEELTCQLLDEQNNLWI